MVAMEVGLRPERVVELAEDIVPADPLFLHPHFDETTGLALRSIAPVDMLRLEQPGLLVDPFFQRCGHGQFLEDNYLTRINGRLNRILRGRSAKCQPFIESAMLRSRLHNGSI